MPRKTQAKILSFIGVADRNCEVNQKRLIEKAQACGAFGGVDWASPAWNVTDAQQHRKRSAKANRPNERIHFTAHAGNGEKVGVPFVGPFAEIMKSLVRLRHLHKAQATNNHMIFIRAGRYVYDALAAKGHDMTLLTPMELDAAARAAFAREDETSAYTIINKLEELANLLDANGITKVRLKWRCSAKKRPASMAGQALEDAIASPAKDDRLPDEAVIQAIGNLYADVPKDMPPEDPRSGERLVILIVSLLVLLGFRLGELLALQAMRVQTAADGSKFLEYCVQKWTAGNATVRREQKPLLTETADLVEAIIDELLQLTEAQRKAAAHIFKTRTLPLELPPADENGEIGRDQVIAGLGLPDKNFAQFCDKRGISRRTVDIKAVPGKSNMRRTTMVKRDDLVKSLLADHYPHPVLPGDSSVRVELHEALCICFYNQMSTSKTTLRHAVVPIHEGNIRDLLMGRESTKQYTKKDGTVSVHEGSTTNMFERYGIRGADGQPLNMRSHGARHFLNDLLDKGGAPDLVQARWFGRKHEKDNRAYQHMTPAERAAEFRQAFLEGRGGGPLAQVVERVPVPMRTSFLEARIHAVHDVGIGMCTHPFTQSACEKHMECSNDCDDFHWIKDDEGRLNEVKRRAAHAWLGLRTAKQKVAEEYWMANDWVQHNQTVLDSLMKQLQAMGIDHFDPERHAQEMGYGEEGDGSEAE